MAATLPSISRPHVHYTIAELEALDLPDNGVRYELVHGQLLVSPLGKPVHQGIAMTLAARLYAYIVDAGLGRVYSPGSVIFGDDSDLQPDVLVVPGRITANWRDITAWWLAVEVLSPSTRKKDLTVKRSAYLEFGVHEIWFVDPAAESVTVVRPAGADVTIAQTGTLSWIAPGAAAPIEIRTADLFV